jgi:hypothetical protein
MYHEFEYRLDVEDGDAEMWCDWRIDFDDLIRLAPLKTTDQKTNAVLTPFKGKALQHLKENTRLVEETDNDRIARGKKKWSEDYKFGEILDRVAKELFPVKHAYKKQCVYLRYQLYIGKSGVREFMTRLHRINACIPYFPKTITTKLNDNTFPTTNFATFSTWQRSLRIK